MKKIFQITWVCLLFLSIHAGAQNLYLSVKEIGTDIPVPAASIRVFASDHKKTFQTSVADDNGNIVLKQKYYPCIIEISATGFETYNQNISSYSPQPFNILLDRKSSALNEVVVTGLTRPMQLQNALSQYRVISNATLQSQGNRNLADALSTQLNMNINNDGILGANIKMQGLKGDKVKILIDGMPLNGREDGNIDLSQINLSNVDHIEMIQGPMSVVYGSDAIGGVINLITKKNSNPLELQGSFNYETVGKYNGDASLTYRLNKRNYFTLGAGANYFNGYRYDDTLISYHGIRFPYHRSLYFKPKEQEFANLSYNYIAPSGFKLQLANDFTNENVTSLGNPYVFDPYNCKASDDYIHTLRNQTRLMLEGKLNNGIWQSQNSYSLYYRTRNNYIRDLVTLNETLNKSLSGEQDTSRYDEFNFRGTYTNKWNQFDYTAGYDVDLQNAHSLKISAEDRGISDYAVYGNVSRPFYRNKFTPQLGLRAAYNNRYPSPLIPSLNLLYKASNDIQWRASYGKGFRAPSLKELYLSFIDLNHDIIGNPNLKPELAQHIEVSYSNRFCHSGNNSAKLVVTGYYNDVTNQIVLVNRDNSNTSANKLTYANIATTRNAIINVQTEMQWKALYLQLGYAYTHILAQDTTRSFNLNEVVVNGRYSWKQTGIDFNIFYKLTGKTPLMNFNSDGSATYSGATVPAFNMLDATIEKKFRNKRIQIIAGVKNIFNVENLKPIGTSVNSTNPHDGNNEVNFLPRRIFTTLRYTFR